MKIVDKAWNAILTAWQVYMFLTAPFGMAVGMEHIHRNSIEWAEDKKR